MQQHEREENEREFQVDEMGEGGFSDTQLLYVD